MNDNLQPLKDEHLEARITAYILGEASPFETAELEALISNSPELQLFLNRTLTLHTLLKEAETTSNTPTKDWKLSPAKRKKLNAILGPENTTPFPKHARIRRASLRTLTGIAALLIITLFISRLYIFPKNPSVATTESVITYMAASDDSPSAEILNSRARAKKVRNSEVTAAAIDAFATELQEPTNSVPRVRTEPSTPASASVSASTQTKEIVASAGQSPVLPEIAALDEKPSLGDTDALGNGWRTRKLGQATIRSNPALPAEHAEKVDQVRRNLYEAQGNHDLGKYDAALESYEEILRVDPYNSAARRGIEKIASAKSDYYRAAYDQTRSELLSEVDSAWNLSVPAELVDKIPNPLAKAMEQENLELDLYADGIQGPEAGLDIENIDEEVHLGDDTNYYFRGLDLGEEKQTQPKINLADLSQEIPASQEPFSTFSLNVSDASFQLARAALERGQQPDPTTIKPEQFYNAIDYGDPAPSSLEPIAAAIDQTAHPIIPGRNLVRIALRTAATGRTASQPLRLTLLVDQSGSMVRQDRRTAMETALKQLATLLTENDKITVIGFSRTPHLLADSLPGDQAEKLPTLINQTASEGGTNLEQAITLASELALRNKLDGAQNRIVLFTDGAANLGNADPTRLAGKIESLRQQSISFDIAGIGTTDLNDNLLSELARHGNGRYYLIGENTGPTLAAQLAGAFRPAAENVKVQVRLNPDRVGNYKLIGFENDRLTTQDFHNDSVDAAELAAEEAGIALYQIQTLPQGTGEIGEVSIRFRQTSTGNMVERTWPIPYTPTAPSLDQAAPKTQLATLALLAAQKLQGGPLADAIHLKDHAPTIANLRQLYSSDPKSQQLLTLIEALK